MTANARWFFLGLLAAASPVAAQPANSCADPYWQDTLRCRSIALTAPGTAPQPNLNDAPASPGGIKEYTRVFLGDLGTRCLDGTRPLLYVSPAICTEPAGCPQPGGGTAPYGQPTRSDRWVVSVTGGGSCNAQERDGNGTFEDGRFCTSRYVGESAEMGSSQNPPMTNLGDHSAAGSGRVMRPDPAQNP